MEPLRKQGFAPVVPQHPRILILGTFPGRASREKGEYYAHPANQFWRILFAVLGASWNHPGYEEKLMLLQSHGVALWDIVASCETQGSADTEIRNPILIDLPGFLHEHPGIRGVFCNGMAGAKYAKGIVTLPVPLCTLPSTSPANARMRYEDKLLRFRQALLPLLPATGEALHG